MDRIAMGQQRIKAFSQGLPAPRVALFTGGTGSRELAIELHRFDPNTSHIINTTDSGRSTRELRMLFDMPGIGDLRSRLIDLSDRTSPGYKEATKLLRHRLPEEATPGSLEYELNHIISGKHELVKNIVDSPSAPSEFAKIIRENIRSFQTARIEAEEQKHVSFDLRSASIGNLFLTGAYLFYRDLEAPIFLYKQLANVRGDVMPATIESIHLAAQMRDDSVLIGQHLITKSDLGPPKRLWFLDREDVSGQRVEPRINPKVIGALKEADIIAFCMGSFSTSLLSTLRITGIAQAIRGSSAAKLFLANPIEDQETTGMAAGSMANEILKVLKEKDSVPGNDTDYLHRVITHNTSGNKTLPGGRKLIPSTRGSLNREIELIKCPGILLENGYYDPENLASILMSFYWN